MDDFETSKVLSNLVTTGIIEIIGEKKQEILKRMVFTRNLRIKEGLKIKLLNISLGLLLIISIITGCYKWLLNFDYNLNTSITQFLKENRKNATKHQIHLGLNGIRRLFLPELLLKYQSQFQALHFLTEAIPFFLPPYLK